MMKDEENNNNEPNVSENSPSANLDETPPNGFPTPTEPHQETEKPIPPTEHHPTKPQQAEGNPIFSHDYFIWFMLFVFAPVGIFLMWKYKKYKTAARIALSIAFGLLFLSTMENLTKSGQLAARTAETEKLRQNLSSAETELKAATTKAAELEKENKTQQVRIEFLESEAEKLQEWRDLYKDFTDAELRTQAEANRLKAEEERLAAEKLQEEERARKQKEQEEERARKQKELEEQIAAIQAEANKGYETGITYEQLARTPDDYKEEKVKFSGRVLQVMEAGSEVQLRVATNGLYDDVLLVYYAPSIVSSRILEEDSITLYGISKGLYTYKSTLGGNITVPVVKVDKIDLN